MFCGHKKIKMRMKWNKILSQVHFYILYINSLCLFVCLFVCLLGKNLAIEISPTSRLARDLKLSGSMYFRWQCILKQFPAKFGPYFRLKFEISKIWRHTYNSCMEKWKNPATTLDPLPLNHENVYLWEIIVTMRLWVQVSIAAKK